MLISNTSILTGKTHTRELPVTSAELDIWMSGELIQNVFPHLSADDREFLMTGITPEEWDTLHGDKDNG